VPLLIGQLVEQLHRDIDHFLLFEAGEGIVRIRIGLLGSGRRLLPKFALASAMADAFSYGVDGQVVDDLEQPGFWAAEVTLALAEVAVEAQVGLLCDVLGGGKVAPGTGHPRPQHPHGVTDNRCLGRVDQGSEIERSV